MFVLALSEYYAVHWERLEGTRRDVDSNQPHRRMGFGEAEANSGREEMDVEVEVLQTGRA